MIIRAGANQIPLLPEQFHQIGRLRQIKEHIIGLGAINLGPKISQLSFEILSFFLNQEEGFMEVLLLLQGGNTRLLG